MACCLKRWLSPAAGPARGSSVFVLIDENSKVCIYLCSTIGLQKVQTRNTGILSLKVNGVDHNTWEFTSIGGPKAGPRCLMVENLYILNEGLERRESV